MGRFILHFDSADTQTVRQLAQSLHQLGYTGELRVGLNGPDKWSGDTPPLPLNELMVVVDHLGDV